jgi:transcriptional regulator of nitric oxide reductase
LGFLNRTVIVIALLAGSITLVTAGGQAAVEPRLKQLFPAATAFSPKEGDPPHFKAYGGAAGSKAVIGYVFWTTEVSPLERGYGGPIPMLVGIDAKGILTGMVMGEHHEPYRALFRRVAPFLGRGLRPSQRPPGTPGHP